MRRLIGAGVICHQPWAVIVAFVRCTPEVDEVQIHHPEGSYKLRSYDGKRIVYRDVGSNAAVAWSKLEVERYAASCEG